MHFKNNQQNLLEELEQAAFAENDWKAALSYLGSVKEKYGITWQEIADYIATKYNVCRDESTLRKLYPTLRDLTDADLYGEEGNASAINTEEKLDALKIEQYKLKDMLTQNRAYLRAAARWDSIEDIVKEAAAQLNTCKPLLKVKPITKDNAKKVGIACLGDWHYGMEFKSWLNTYNPEIAKERLSNYVGQVITQGELFGIKELFVLNLGDLIAGRIHNSIRYESRFDVITQIMHVSEMLAEALTILSQHFRINYYACSDNHSRLEPNKSDAINAESLCRITDWHLATRLRDNVNISINKNKFDEDIITFNAFSFKIAGVHGDKDQPRSVIEKIDLLTQQHYDLICTAHLHHFSGDEHCDTVVIGNGSLMGTDSYSKNARLHSRPSQNLIIVSEDNVIKHIDRILV